MCILVDTCAINSVFNSQDQFHKEFEPVYEWIYNGPGKVLYGGTHFMAEIRPFLHIFAELSRQNKTIHLKDHLVDEEEKIVKSLESDPDFDDPHLIAILRISKALLVCTKDIRAIKFLKKRKLYPKNQHCPKLYTSKRNKDILTIKNIPKNI